jgi:hypothetical protein
MRLLAVPDRCSVVESSQTGPSQAHLGYLFNQLSHEANDGNNGDPDSPYKVAFTKAEEGTHPGLDYKNYYQLEKQDGTAVNGADIAVKEHIVPESMGINSNDAFKGLDGHGFIHDTVGFKAAPNDPANYTSVRTQTFDIRVTGAQGDRYYIASTKFQWTSVYSPDTGRTTNTLKVVTP